MEIKELNTELIKSANSNSMSGKRGDTTNADYISYCEKVISWHLSERKTQKLLDKIYAYFSRSIALEASHVSVAVAGASNYNAKKLDKSDAILRTASDFCEWFHDLEDQINRKPVEWRNFLMKEITWGVEGGYDVKRQWRQLAARYPMEFQTLYETLDERHHFAKTSVAYKIYHGIEKVEEIKRITIFESPDYSVFSEAGYIYIRFRLKPSRQLIVALKSRKFTWYSDELAWRAPYDAERRNWACFLVDNYADYI